MKTSPDSWVRKSLGLFLILYALNQFLHILPTSYGAMPDISQQFLDSIIMYLPYLYFFELFVGVMLFMNFWSSLVLLVLFPLSASFLFFNFVNGDLEMMMPAIVVAFLNFYLLIKRWNKYQLLLD